MAERQYILTSKAPKPGPTLSQAIVNNGIVYVCGQIGAEPVNKKLVSSSLADQTRQALDNLSAILEASGSSLRDALRIRIFVADITKTAEMNEVYKTYFPDQKPVRTCVGVSLPQGILVEIDCDAALSPSSPKL